MRKFAHLHVHSIYSVSDALGAYKEYINKMHKYNFENQEELLLAIAASEHGNTSSHFKLKEACETEIQMTKEDIKRTIKPIYGCEIYHSLWDTKTDKRNDPSKNKKEQIEKEGKFIPVEENEFKKTYHLLLLAKNNEGYQNLIKIASHGGINSFKYGATVYRTDIPFLKEHGKGIVCSSACLGGFIPKLLMNGEYDRAKEIALMFNEIFEEFYLELQANDEEVDQVILNQKILQLSEDTGIEIIITNDVHYVEKEDRPAHDILYAIARSNKKDEEIDFTKVKGLPGYYHLKTPDEMEKFCIKYDIPLSAMDNTVKIAESCNVDLLKDDKKFFMPKYPVPNGYTEETYLEKLCYEKLFENIRKKQLKDSVKDRFKRLRYELSVINNAGYAGYFLIVSDFLQKCRDKGILIGPGRGSAAGLK